jgi:hypothetical protein
MSLAELIPHLQTLAKAEKVKLVHLLVEDLAQEECTVRPGAEYPIWTPLSAHDAGRTLLNALHTEKSSS